MASVLVDALSAHAGGGLSYLLQQLPALERVAPDLTLHVLAAPWSSSELGSVLDSPIDEVKIANRNIRALWEQTVLALRARSSDLLYCPGNFAPLAAGAPVVLTLQNPNYFGSGRQLAHNRTAQRRAEILMCHLSVRRAGRVVTISDSLRREVLADLPWAKERLVTIPSGAPTWPSESIPPPALPELDSSYVLVLANDAPHKNLDVAVASWARAQGAGGPALVIAGEVDAERASHLQQVAGAASRRLHLLGPIKDRRHVRWLLEHAAALLAVPSHEAHPLTPAEAGSLGCRAVLSDIPAHREVAGENAIYVPPGDTEAIAAALGGLADAGPARRWVPAQSWEDNASHLASLIRDLVAERRR